MPDLHSDAVITEGSGFFPADASASHVHANFPNSTYLRNRVLPEVFKNLQQGRPHEQIWALKILALWHQSAPQEMDWQEHISGPQSVSEAAILARGLVKDSASMTALVNLMRGAEKDRRRSSNFTRARTFAAYGLGLFAAETEKEAVRSYIAAALLDALQEPSTPVDVQVACALALGQIPLRNPNSTASKLLNILENQEQDLLLRAHLPNSVAKLLESRKDSAVAGEAVNSFSQLLGHKSTPVQVRQSCAQALGLLVAADSPYAKRITAQLKKASTSSDPSQQVRAFALMAMAYIGATGGPSHPLVANDILPHFLQQVQRQSSELQGWYALALGIMSARSAWEQHPPMPGVVGHTLAEELKHTKNPSPRGALALALGLGKFQNHSDVVSNIFEDTAAPGLSGTLAVALGLLEHKPSADALLERMEKTRFQPILLRDLTLGLGLMSDPRCVEELLGYLEPQKGRATMSEISAAAFALGVLGNHRAVPALVKMLETENMSGSRAAAGQALSEICDPRDLPLRCNLSCDLNYPAAIVTITDPYNGTGVLNLL